MDYRDRFVVIDGRRIVFQTKRYIRALAFKQGFGKSAGVFLVVSPEVSPDERRERQPLERTA